MKTDEEPRGMNLHETITSSNVDEQNEEKTKKAFSKISRELSEDDLKSPGTQRLLLSEIDQYEECKKQLEFYRTKYFEKLADCRVYEERLKSNATLEVASGCLLALGPALMTLAPTIVDKKGEWYYLSTILLVIGIVMLLGGITTKILKNVL